MSSSLCYIFGDDSAKIDYIFKKDGYIIYGNSSKSTHNFFDKNENLFVLINIFKRRLLNNLLTDSNYTDLIEDFNKKICIDNISDTINNSTHFKILTYAPIYGTVMSELIYNMIPSENRVVIKLSTNTFGTDVYFGFRIFSRPLLAMSTFELDSILLNMLYNVIKLNYDNVHSEEYIKMFPFLIKKQKISRFMKFIKLFKN